MPTVRRGLESTSTKRERIALIVVAAVFGLLTGAPGIRGREWWVIPPLAFVAILALMLLSKRRPITAGWVAIAAIVAVATGVVLRVL